MVTSPWHGPHCPLQLLSTQCSPHSSHSSHPDLYVSLLHQAHPSFSESQHFSPQGPEFMQPVSYNIQDTYFGREYFKDCLNTCVPVGGGVGGDVCSINGAAAHKLAKQESLPSEKGWCKGGKMWQMPMSKALDFLPHASFLWWWSNRMESKWHQGNYQ